MVNSVSLNKGHYSGKIVDIHYYEKIIVGTTVYPEEIGNSSLHYHQNPHISLLLQGGHLEKKINADFERVPGDILFCYAGESHQFLTKRFPSKNINIEVDTDFLKQYNISENCLNNAVYRNLDSKSLLLKAYKESLTNDELTEVSIQMLILSMVTTSEMTLHKKKPQWIRLLIEILNDRWNEPISLKELSLIVQVHPVTISKTFTKYFGCTLGAYMRKMRVNKSINLIRNQELSLTDIAYTCGFTDQSHFIRSFKEATGWLPKRFKSL